MTTIGQTVALHHVQIAEAVAVVAGFIASHVTAFLTHEHAPAKVKAPIAAVTAALAGVIASVGWAPHQPWYGWVQAIFYALVSSQATFLLKQVSGVALTQKAGLSLGASKLDPNDGGSTLITLLVFLVGAILVIVGAVELIVAASRNHPHLSAGGLILLLVGVVVVVVSGRIDGRMLP